MDLMNHLDSLPSLARSVDPTTLTFWHSRKAMTDFAYAPGVHNSHQMSRQHAHPMADRISSARSIIFRSEGRWYGTDPSRPRK